MRLFGLSSTRFHIVYHIVCLINEEHLKLHSTLHISAEICGVGNFPICLCWCMFPLLEEV